MIMNETSIERVHDFLSSIPRHRLIICRVNPSPNHQPINLGYELAKRLTITDKRDNISYDAAQIVDDIFNKATTKDDVYGDFVIIENIGILFEPKLNLNPTTVLSKHSKHKTVFLIWKECCDRDSLFYKHDSNYRLDLSNISHVCI